MKPEPVVLRLREELAQLDTRREALRVFIAKGMPHVQSEEERDLLPQQLSLMDSYAEVLTQRLGLP